METTIGFIGSVGFRRNGREHGNFNNGFYRDCCKDPLLHSGQCGCGCVRGLAFWVLGVLGLRLGC